jgi:hypothetical protein
MVDDGKMNKEIIRRFDLWVTYLKISYFYIYIYNKRCVHVHIILFTYTGEYFVNNKFTGIHKIKQIMEPFRESAKLDERRFCPPFLSLSLSLLFASTHTHSLSMPLDLCLIGFTDSWMFLKM